MRWRRSTRDPMTVGDSARRNVDLVLFPLFMAVATIESSRLRDTIVITSMLFLALFSALFVTLHRIY